MDSGNNNNTTTTTTTAVKQEETSKPKVFVSTGSHKKAFVAGLISTVFLAVLAVGMGSFYINQRTTTVPKASEGNLPEQPNPQLIDQTNLLKSTSTVALTSLVATDAGGLNLESGKTYSSNIVNFSWQTTPPSDPTAVSKGYYVYFGTKNPALEMVDPSTDGTFTSNPNFTANNLKKGTTYYLAIQAEFRRNFVVSVVNLKANFIYNFDK